MNNFTLGFINPLTREAVASYKAPTFRVVDMDKVPKNRFLVSEDGKIYDLKNGEFKKTSVTYNGYEQVYLGRTVQVQTVVASAFLDDYTTEKGMVVDHINGDRLNNHWSNLQMLSHSENTRKGRKKFTRDTYLVRIYDEETGAFIKEFGSMQAANDFFGYKEPSTLRLYFYHADSDEILVKKKFRVIRKKMN